MFQFNFKVNDERENRLKPSASPAKAEALSNPILSPASVNARLSPARRAKPNSTQASSHVNAEQQMRMPPIIGEVSLRGTIPVDGIVCGVPGANGGSLTIRQRGRPFFGSDPELNGDMTFRDLLRVNGYIAGSLSSTKGTLIVDAAAQIDANIEVSVAMIGGVVNGDIVAHQRVELGPGAKIHGNISTRSLSMQDGAIFDGECQMIAGAED